MKIRNKVFAAIVVVAFAVAGALNVGLNYRDGSLSDLTLANIEALASVKSS